MNVDEAREKFGRMAVGPDGEERWELNPNKIRGLFLKYSREVEYLEGSTDTPKGEEYVDHFWGWCKDKIGVGYKGILQCNRMSPSGRFDRLGKESAAYMLDAYYEAHDEFQENMDEVWHEQIPDIARRDKYDTTEEMLKDMNGADIIELFFHIYDGHDKLIAGNRQSPDKRAYKYHIKHWVFQKETIQSEEDEPYAEGIVEQWLEWMADEILTTEAPIVDRVDEDEISTGAIPTADDIAGWVRELWVDSKKFKEQVKDKWNKELEKDEGDGPDMSDMNRIDRGRRSKKEKREGQQNLEAFTQ